MPTARFLKQLALSCVLGIVERFGVVGKLFAISHPHFTPTSAVW